MVEVEVVIMLVVRGQEVILGLMVTAVLQEIFENLEIV